VSTRIKDISDRTLGFFSLFQYTNISLICFFQDYEFFTEDEAEKINNMAELDKLAELLEVTQ